jgi:putative addiction module component (TIGR02574 family)
MTTAERLAYLRDEAMKLPVQERRELVRSLEGSLDDLDDDAFDLHPAWRLEIEQRIADIDSGVAKGVTPAEMMAQVRARLGW